MCVFLFSSVVELFGELGFRALLIFWLAVCLYLELLSASRYLNESHVLQLGGVNENLSYEYPQLQYKHFTGCIRNLLVDSKVLRGADRTVTITSTTFHRNIFVCICMCVCE